MAKQEKTEKATPKRRSEARRKGQVARSVELNSALVLLATFWTIKAMAPYMLATLTDLIRTTFLTAGSTTLTQENLGPLFLSVLVTYVKLAGPIIGVASFVGVAVSFGQVGAKITLKQVSPKLDKLNPLNGFKRLFSPRSLVELIKSVLKIILVGYVGYSVLVKNYSSLIGLIDMDLAQTLRALGEIAYELGMRTGTALLILAIFDYAYQKYSFERSLRMTKQEVKEEIRQAEGDPKIKSKIKKKQFELAMSRMMQEVPKADVIITNPIHLAVALRYDSEEMNAPKVIAKGQRLVAERIKEIAEAHRIPIVEDVFLAQSLYRSVEIGREVPLELYKAVAEVLAYVYQLSVRRAV